MPAKGRDESKEALLQEDLDSRRSIDGDSEDESAALVGEQKGSAARAYEKKSSGIFTLRWPGKKSICICLLLFLVGIVAFGASGYYIYQVVEPPYGQSPPWYPTPLGGTEKSWAESYRKAAALVREMNLLEKVNITTGVGWGSDLCVGNTGPAVHAGFPPLCLQDGPLGIRFADHITAFPAGITVAATWNRDLMYRRGRTHAKEARTKGVNVLLGPAMGPMGRMPAGGRNWEGFGADPVLQAIAAAETIKGIQDEGVQATAKHLVGQEQEHYRQQFAWGIPHAISSNIDDRTLHEVYAWPFAESIRAGVASVMCSYNQVNNSYACGNSKLMNGLIKDELGFQGYVQSDWLAKRSGIASALAGLDMDMPGDGKYWLDGNSLWGEKITVGALNESLPMERLNDMVTRIVAAWYQLGQDDKKTWPPPPPEGDGGPNFSSWTDDRIGKLHHFSGENITGVVNKFIDAQGVGEDFHGRLVKEIAVEATILLKNEDNVLPLNRKGAEGLPTDQTYNVGIFGEDAGPGQGPNFCEDRGCNQGTLASGWGSGAVEFPYLVTPYQALESEFDRKYVNITEHLSNSIPTKSTIAGQDLCLVFVNSDSGEGYIKWKDVAGDRPDISIQKDGDKLVRAVAKDCGNDKGSTIVIVHSVGPAILEPWIDIPNVKGVIWANLPGQESGNALASILFGDADPSGRLPYTIAKSLDDYGPGGQIQYYPNGVIPQQDFKEGLFIDYRHFDKYSIKPRYEFGFGLSYTTFSYSDIRLATLKRKSPLPDSRPPPSLSPPTYDSTLPDAATALFPAGMHRVHNRIYPYISSVSNVKKGSYPYPDGYNNTQTPSPAGGGLGGNPSLFEDHVSVSFTVTNTGSRAGKDVAQIYVSFPDNVQNEGGELVEFPVKVLRQFEKVALEPGESKEVEVRLNRKDLSFWDVWRQNWVMPVEGEIEVLVGRSVRDIVLKGAW